MIFLVTRKDEEYGYVCSSEDVESLAFCLTDIENEMLIRFVSLRQTAVGDVVVTESRFDELIEWDVYVVDYWSEELPEDVLVLVKKEMAL